MLNPSALVAEARARLNHASTTVITEDKLTAAFNAALERWAMDTLSLERVLLIDIVAGQASYSRDTLFPTLIQIRQVTVKDAAGSQERLLPYAPEDEFPLPSWGGGGLPRLFTLKGDDFLWLWPLPTVSLQGALALYAYVLPDNYQSVSTNTDSLPFPQTHREGIVQALSINLCKLNLEDHTLAARLPLALDDYNRELSRIESRAGRPNTTLVMGRRTRHRMRLSINPFDPVRGERYSVIGRW